MKDRQSDLSDPGPMERKKRTAQRRAVSDRKPGPTLAEVARIAGVSQMTVSRALNDQPGVSTRVRGEIIRIADEMGYVGNWVAKKLSSARNGTDSGIIGVIAGLHTPFIGDVVTAIGSAARSGGRDMLVYSHPAPGKQMPRNVLDLMLQAVDGVIAVLPRDTEYMTVLSRARVPVVGIDRRDDDLTLPWVSADDYQGACLATRHLIELGHQRIAFIAGDLRLFSARERLRGFRDSLEQAGLSVDPAYVVHGEYQQDVGLEAARTLLSLPVPPTAIFAANDLSAVGAMTAARDAGLETPADISIIGFDDIPLANQVQPGLTTIRQPFWRMGWYAVDMLLSLKNDPDTPPEPVTLPVELVVRGTTATPKQ